MKLLLKTALILATVFLSTFFVIKFTGVLTVDDINKGFVSLQQQPVYVIGALVALLLFADLFIAVPTMTVIVLAGYFLGFKAGALFAFIGISCAGLAGYFISLRWGDKLLLMLEKDSHKIEEMRSRFTQHGILLLVLSRAAPILPEVSACLAGASRMPFKKFLLGWLLGSVPYLLIVSYAGSISSLDNPMPVIFTAVGISGALWVSMSWYMRKHR